MIRFTLATIAAIVTIVVASDAPHLLVRTDAATMIDLDELFVASPIVSYQNISLPTEQFVVSPIVSYQQFETSSGYFAFSPVVSYTDGRVQPGQDLQPGNQVSLDHLWQWDATAQPPRFVDPGPAGVTIVPTQPTYLLTHGWDGTLDGVAVGEVCAETKYAMQSIGCAIRQALPNVNLLAWDWKEQANPNQMCDFPASFTEEVGALLRYSVSPGLALGNPVVKDAWKSGLKAHNEGVKLGNKLVKLLDAPGFPGLGTELHFIGKSHGGGVLGAAATRLNAIGHPIDTLSTLDTPRAVCDSKVCWIDPLANVDASVVNSTGHVAVYYYTNRLHGGAGAPVTPPFPTLTNIMLNDEHAPSPSLLHSDWVTHLWISGFDEGNCPPDDGWFPLIAWNNDPNLADSVTFIDEAIPMRSVLDVRPFPSGDWIEQERYTFAPTGACCSTLFPFDPECEEITEEECLQRPSPVYHGNGSTCGPDADGNRVPDLCEVPVGACCSQLFPGGMIFCDERPGWLCAGVFGTFVYHGDGTTCADGDANGTADICEAAARLELNALPGVAFDNFGASLLAYEPFYSAVSWSGNLVQLAVAVDPMDAVNRVIVMDEQGDASFFKDIVWPAGSLLVSFDYMFREPRGAENLTVYVGDKIVYYDNAEITLARDQLTSSGEIYVGDVSGQTARLNFVLRTDQPDGGALGGGVLIDNIRVFGFVSGDADLDADRDLADFSAFAACFLSSPVTEGCWAFDVNGDDTVNEVDFAAFQGQLNGPMLPPIP